MARILLVDDDRSLVKLLEGYLAREGHETVARFDGPAGLEALATAAPDLVLLDIRMPGMDGWQTLERFKAGASVPVIMLTALGDEADVLRGFAMGADDYVQKPFSFAQLAARIGAVLQRTRQGSSAEVLAVGGLVVDLGTRRVLRDGEPVALTPTEFKLLVALMGKPGRVLTPLQLVTHVWGPGYAQETDYIRRYIWHLRRKVEQDPDCPRYVLNQRGVGYYFAPDR